MSNLSARPDWECYRIAGVSAPDKWREMIVQKLDSMDSLYSYDLCANGVRVWRNDTPAVPVRGKALTCRNGYRIERVAFGGARDQTLIGIKAARVTFEEGSGKPTHLSAADLFSRGGWPIHLRHQPLIEGIPDLVRFLRSGDPLSRLENYEEFQSEALSSQIIYRMDAGEHSLTSLVEGKGFSKNLLQVVRNERALRSRSILLGLTGGTGAHTGRVSQIARRVVNVLHSWGCDASWVELYGADPETIKGFFEETGNAVPVVLVPLVGKRGDRPLNAEIDLLRALAGAGGAFQLCSTATDPSYSQHGLATSILAKAGGTHFSVSPRDSTLFDHCWYVGLDLGWGGLSDGRVAVITLTDSDGRLRAYWRAVKNKTESIPKDVLKQGLQWIARQANALNSDRSLFVIRDGRIPEDEAVADYREALAGISFTLVEYAKGGSPLIHFSGNEPPPGTIIMPNVSKYTAMYPCVSPQRGILTAPIKFSNPVNPLNLDPVEIGSALLALCHSATLSFQPARIPAPIQWANGLAKLSWTDLQFSGWSHLPNCLVDYRARLG